jgi:hypothetical protein
MTVAGPRIPSVHLEIVMRKRISHIAAPPADALGADVCTPDSGPIGRAERSIAARSTPIAEAAASLGRALRLLQAASPDWRHRGPTDGTDRLHWPCAVAAAQAHIEHALQLMARS